MPKYRFEYQRNMQVRKGSKEHIEACLSIAKELSQYFPEKAIAAMSQDLQEHRLYIAVDSDEVIGFVAIQLKSSQVAEISWMAVKAKRQHQGVGSQLIDHIADDLKGQEIRLLQVKTLASNVDYAPYELTRQFYEKRGFVHLETIDPFPEWEPGNPGAIYVKVV